MCGYACGSVRQAYGKGQKTRYVLISEGTYQKIAGLEETRRPAGPVFVSARGGQLADSQVWRIVKAAAQRAELLAGVFPHWLRHAHASHALDRGAPISLVQTTLGHASVQATGKYLHGRTSRVGGISACDAYCDKP